MAWAAGAWYLIISAVTLGVYLWDKRAAARGAWRVRERTLHLLAALGGFAGALAGQHWLRHKSQRASFLMVTPLFGAAHVGGWVWWLLH